MASDRPISMITCGPPCRQTTCEITANRGAAITMAYVLFMLSWPVLSRTGMPPFLFGKCTYRDVGKGAFAYIIRARRYSRHLYLAREVWKLE